MAEDKSSQDRFDQLNERLTFIESVLREQIARLYSIERHLGISRQPAEAAHPRHEQINAQTPPQIIAPATPAQPLIAQKPEREPGPQTASHATPQTDALPRPQTRRVLNIPEPSGPVPKRVTAEMSAEQMRAEQSRASRISRSDLEARIGGSLFNWIGVVAICFGVAFFLKYAFENQWIGPTGRVLIGVVIGLGFLTGAEVLRARGYSKYAHGLSGGGILILYLSVFAAFKLYNLIPHLLAFILMAAITTTASLLAARYNALPIAILGLIGGFLTPVLLSTGRDNQVELFSYIALLDAGVLALAYSKQWRSLNYLAFISTVLMFTAWEVIHYTPEKLWTTIFFLTLFFIIFALVAALYNVIHRRPTQWLDLSLVFLNALFYFGVTYELLDDHHHAFLGFFAVAIASFYLALGYFTYTRDREDKLLVLTFLGLAFLFAVLAVPIQLDQHWVTIGWAVQGAVMTWVGLRAGDRTSRYAALAVFAIAVSHWFIIDVPGFAYNAAYTFLPLFNSRALSCVALIASLAFAAKFYKQTQANVESNERSILRDLFLLTANALAVILLTLDASDYFEQQKVLARMEAEGRQPSSLSGALAQISNTEQFTFSALWGLYATGVLAVGILRDLKRLRVAALALLAAATFKVLILDASYHVASWHTTIFNQTFAAFALLIAAFACAAWFYIKSETIDQKERSIAVAVLIGVAATLTVIALSLEVNGYFERFKEGIDLAAFNFARIENTKQFALSALWSACGATMLLVGLARGLNTLRFGGLLLLAITTIKVLAIDLRYYDAEWHMLIVNQTFAAFALLIIALACAVWAYSRAKEIDEQERSRVVKVVIGLANVLAIIALSLEASGYFERQMRVAGLGGDSVELQLAERLSLSVIWTIYGGAMLAIGIIRRNRLLRVMALLLLGLTILKVFLVDLALLEKIYRIISFIVLGAILLVVSFLYQRYRRRMMDLIDIDPADAEAQATTD